MSQERRILVTAAGAGPAVAVIKAIAGWGPPWWVAGVDMDEYAAGRYLAHAHATVPPARDPAYVDRMLEVATAHGVRLAIPIFDLETPVWATHRARFEAAGIAVACNSLACIEAGNDKTRSFDVCAAAGIVQPERFAGPDDAPPDAYPILGKPLRGIGSAGIVDLPSKTARRPEGLRPERYLWQRFVRGPEFTIDTFGRPDRGPFVAVPRHRRVVRAGQMVQGPTVAGADLQAVAAAVCRAFDVTDVACVQVIREEGTGRLHFIEINPRYGTGVSLSIAAGVRFPELQWLAAFEPAAITPERLRWKAGLEMIRYWEEVYR